MLLSRLTEIHDILEFSLHRFKDKKLIAKLKTKVRRGKDHVHFTTFLSSI